MNKLLLISVVGLVFLGLTLTQFDMQSQQTLEFAQEGSLLEKFNQWKQENGKVYASEQINQYRFQVYLKNLKKILQENSKGHTYTLGETIFMDITQDEFISIYLRNIDSDNQNIDESMPVINGAINWATKGAVTPVKNQGSCGSCWAFSTTGTVEGYWKINKGSLPNLSEQQLVDCSTANFGCDGGWPYKALAWVQKNGLTTESAYPYKGVDQTCKISSGSYKIGGYTTGKGCPTLTTKINTQPTSVCVDASNWSLYKSGVFHDCGTTTNHAVLATGYDSNGNWIIKNSWGTSWGQKGYITLQSQNTCGVCSQIANAN